MEETKELTKRSHALSYNALPEDVIDGVKYLTLDYLGVAARGSLSESSAPILNFISNRDMVRLGFFLDPKAHYAQGFHPTGACGTMGSALTIGLSKER